MTQSEDMSIAQMSESEFNKIQTAFGDTITGYRGAASPILGAFFGYWRRENGSNLRVGRLQDGEFTSASEASAQTVKAGEKISVVLRQLYLPNLPHKNCVAQVTWQASHLFDNNTKTQVTHVTSCDVSRASTAGAVGLPIFLDLKTSGIFELSISIYVMADQESLPVLDLLQSASITGGLKLAEEFIPVFAMTSPYINAAIQGLVKASERNFKLVKWNVGFGIDDGAPVPLSYGDYIFLNGVIREKRKETQLAWSDLNWDNETDRPKYKNGNLSIPYLIVSVLQPK